MRNIAKCKLCGSVVESFTIYDYVECTCGEIAVSGGNYKFDCFAKDFANFLRLDDQGNEIVVKVRDNSSEDEEVIQEEAQIINFSREQKIEMVDTVIKYYEDMPDHANSQAITNYDVRALLLLIKQLI